MGAVISDATMKRANEAVASEVAKKFSSAAKGTDLHKLALGMGLLALLDTRSLGSDQNETLEDYDPEARGILGMRRSQLQQLVDQLLAKPEIKEALRQARAAGLVAALGSDYRQKLEAFAQQIASEAFYKELSSLSDAARTKRLEDELAKLSALDPDLALQAATGFMAREIANNPGKILQNLSPEECARAVDKVLCLVARMPDDKSTAEEVVGDAKTGTRAVGTGTKLRTLLQHARTRARIANVLGRSLTHRSYYSAVADDAEAARLIAEFRAQGHHDAAFVVEKLRDGTPLLRGIASFSSLVALAGIATSWPPVDAEGNVQITSVTTMAGAGLAVTATIPTIGKFAGTDMTPLIARVLGEELKISKAAVAAGARVSAIANAAKFARLCKWLGPIGDALFIPIMIKGVVDEVRNEDGVGIATSTTGAVAGITGLAGGLMILFGASGVGVPLAAIAAVIGLAAVAVDWMFGESALTGQVRQDLRYLGISGAEEATFRDMTTREETVQYYDPYTGPRSYQARRNVPMNTVRQTAAGAGLYQKVQLINQYMDQSTSGREETLIYNVLQDSPDDEFLKLVEALDTRKLADELEDDAQNAAILSRIGTAYGKAGRKPGKALEDYVTELASQHREGPIRTWLAHADQAVYGGLDPKVVKDSTHRLMSGITGGSEESAIFELLNKTTYPQFNTIMESGGVAYARQLRSELSVSQWRRLHGRMADGAPGRASPHVRHIATQLPLHTRRHR